MRPRSAVQNVLADKYNKELKGNQDREITKIGELPLQFPFDPFQFFFGIFGFLTIIPIIAFIIILISVAKFCERVSQGSSGFTVQPPAFVIPERHRRQSTRSDGSTMQTVRLPERCPSCGASLSHESIDWVGPLEAECNYCGATVRATFEEI